MIGLFIFELGVFVAGAAISAFLTAFAMKQKQAKLGNAAFHAGFTAGIEKAKQDADAERLSKTVGFFEELQPDLKKARKTKKKATKRK